MTDKIVLVTGATGGIGLAIAGALVAQGARVLITGRDELRGREARELLLAGSPDGHVEYFSVDHRSLASNRNLAERVATATERLDVLINNAGGLFVRREVTDDGLESTLAMNCVAPFALTQGLLPLMRATGGARVINVISSAYSMWRGDPFAALDMGRTYVGIEAYARAKLMNLLWTLALARREPGIIVLAANPGMAWTPNTASFTPEAVPAWRLIWPLVRWMQKRASAVDAARPAVFLSTAPGLESNSSAYLESDLKWKSLTPDLLDPSRQDLAWDVTANLGSRPSS